MASWRTSRGFIVSRSELEMLFIMTPSPARKVKAEVVRAVYKYNRIKLGRTRKKNIRKCTLKGTLNLQINLATMQTAEYIVASRFFVFYFSFFNVVQSKISSHCDSKVLFSPNKV